MTKPSGAFVPEPDPFAAEIDPAEPAAEPSPDPDQTWIVCQHRANPLAERCDERVKTEQYAKHERAHENT